MGQSPPGNTYNRLGRGTPLLNGPTEFGPHHPIPAIWTTASTKVCKTGDLLFCVRGSTTGRMNWADRPYCLGRGVAAIRAKSGKSDTRLIYYNLANNLPRLLSFCAGSVFPNLSRQDMNGFEVQWPDKDSRPAIAHILGTLDDKIELARRMNETLEAMARAIFKSWFMDFDPVRAKAEGRKPDGIDADTAALFPDSFEDSPIGKIPKRWKLAGIGEVVKVVGGSTPSTGESSFWDGNFNFATPKDLASLSAPFLLNTERRITEEGLQKISSGLLPKGTVLLSSRAPIGYLAIAEIPVAVNQGFIGIICDKELPNFYILNWAQQNMDNIISNANGTTFLEISKKNFRPIKVLVPTHDILYVFIRLVKPVYEKIIKNLIESRTLAAIRNALLPRLLSGEVRIRDAEKMAAGAGVNP